MALKYIPLVLFLIAVSIIIPGCNNSLKQCNSSSPQDNFYCYVPRIIPGSGVPMKWFPCSQNDKGTVHKSCRYKELDEECFIFVRAEYKDGIVRPLAVEVTPMKLIDKDPDKVDMSKGPILGELKYPVEYFYVNKRDLLDTRNESIYQGKKIKVAYLFKEPFLAYQTATLYDSAFDGTLSDEVRKKFTVDSVGKGCTRILGKSLCEKPEFAAARCNTIPCADFTQSKNFEPFDPTLWKNKYYNPNIYPLLRNSDYVLCKGDKNRFAYVNFTITKNIDHIHQVKFTRNNVETIISLDPENRDSLNREYIRHCSTNEATKSKRYVVKIPITAFRNNYVLYDKALEKVVYSDLIYGAIDNYNTTRHMTLHALTGSGLNAITENDTRVRADCRSSFSETLHDAFSLDNKTDLKNPIPYNKLHLGIYFRVEQKDMPDDTYFDSEGNIKIDAAKILQLLVRDFPNQSEYPKSLQRAYNIASLSKTYYDMAIQYNAKENPIIFYANSFALAEKIDGSYVKIKRTPPKYRALKSPEDLLKGEAPDPDGKGGIPAVAGMTGPHFTWEIDDRSCHETISSVFKVSLVNYVSPQANTNNCAALVMVHELGHLWSPVELMAADRKDTTIAESDRHSYYCTGKNADICIFRYTPPLTNKSEVEAYKIYNKVGAIWCEGHKQILLNINEKQIVE